jgi:hypothetical protein
MRQKWVESANSAEKRIYPCSNQGSDLSLQGPGVTVLKMAHTATEIGSIVQELAPGPGRRLDPEDLPTASPTACCWRVRVPGHTRRLLCSLRDGTARIHLVRESLPNPPTPPSFLPTPAGTHTRRAYRRHHTHTPGDRIVRLDSDEPGWSGRPWSRNCFGRNADLLFLNGERHVSLATLRHNRDRVGQVYQAPLGTHHDHRPPRRLFPHRSLGTQPTKIHFRSHPGWKFSTVNVKQNCRISPRSDSGNRHCEKHSRNFSDVWKR